MIGIYKITSPTGKVYIGQSREIEKRWYNHTHIHYDTHISRSIQKYGGDAHVFEVAHELPIDVERSVINTYEKFYMDQYRECGFEMLNMAEAGYGGACTPEAAKKISAALKGRKHSKEHRENHRKSMVGFRHKPETLAKLQASNVGRTHSDETKLKMSMWHKGKPKSIETRIKLSEARKLYHIRKKLNAANS